MTKTEKAIRDEQRRIAKLVIRKLVDKERKRERREQRAAKAFFTVIHQA